MAGEMTMVDGWQPIETGPKDGTLIFAFVLDFQRRPQTIVGRLWRPGVVRSSPGKWDYTATHWMPLPEPPSPTLRDERRTG